MQNERGVWSSRWGFILAAAGSAIGLGNIWRYPYMVGENGGAAFVVLYLFFVLIIGLPYLMAEFALGRATQLNPVDAIEKVRPKSFWKVAGFLGIVTSFGILSFYGVIAGWTFGYIFKSLYSDAGDFATFISNPINEVGLYAFFILITALIVYKGVASGIEKWSKILMPLLLAIIIGLIVYANLLPGAGKGIEFYLLPDFSKVTSRTVLAALGQAFFSLSLGLGLMVTFGSYIPKTTNIFSSSIIIALSDTAIAIMGGLIVFPALFAMGEDPASGPSLVFIIFPKLFTEMPGGEIVGAFFFLLLSIAALTSTISLLEVPVSYFVDRKKLPRQIIVWFVAGFVFVAGLPSALSQGAVEFFSNFALISPEFAEADFLSQMSFIFGEIFLTIGALILSIFIGWVWGAKNAVAELRIGADNFSKFENLWTVLIKYIIPVVVVIILFGIFKIW